MLELPEDLRKALDAAKARVASMTDEERAEMYQKQRESYVRAESEWPKPKFHYDESGAKVYESYEDYCNG